jgi:hypothetical protein
VTRLTLDGLPVDGNLISLPIEPVGTFEVEAFVE